MSDYNTSQAVNQAPIQTLTDEFFDWRGKKFKTLRLDDIYQAAGYPEYALRAKSCSTHLEFLEQSADIAPIQDEAKKRLHGGNFCNLRLCPMCTSRKALKAAKRLCKALEQCKEQHPNCQFIFLTLTIKNVTYGELSKALTLITEAWGKLRRHRKIERAIKGWFRAIEITYSADKGFHPHIHAILVVEDDYFNRKLGLYITKDEWIQHWRKALQVDYNPIVDIKATHAKTKHSVKQSAIVAGAVEAAKYSVKDSEYIDERLSLNEAATIVREYTEALYKKRLTAYGGWLKEIDEEADLSADVYDLLTHYGWHFGQGDYLLQGVAFYDADEDA